MIILLYGPDSYRRQIKTKEILDEYAKKRQSPVIGHFSFPEDFFNLQEFCRNRSIFENIKVGVVSNVFGEKSKKEIKSFLKSNLENSETILIISEDKKPTKDFDFLLAPPVKNQEFTELTLPQLKFFTQKEAAKLGIILTDKALSFLANFFGDDIWGLMTEIEKIASLGKKTVDIEDVKRAGDFRSALDSFYLINSLNYEKSPLKRLVILEALLSGREEPAKIFNILASRSFLSPGLTQKMADYDVAVKSGKIDYEEVLVDLVLA